MRKSFKSVCSVFILISILVYCSGNHKVVVTPNKVSSEERDASLRDVAENIIELEDNYFYNTDTEILYGKLLAYLVLSNPDKGKPYVFFLEGFEENGFYQLNEENKKIHGIVLCQNQEKKKLFQLFSKDGQIKFSEVSVNPEWILYRFKDVLDSNNIKTYQEYHTRDFDGGINTFSFYTRFLMSGRLEILIDKKNRKEGIFVYPGKNKRNETRFYKITTPLKRHELNAQLLSLVSNPNAKFGTLVLEFNGNIRIKEAQIFLKIGKVSGGLSYVSLLSLIGWIAKSSSILNKIIIINIERCEGNIHKARERFREDIIANNMVLIVRNYEFIRRKESKVSTTASEFLKDFRNSKDTYILISRIDKNEVIF